MQCIVWIALTFAKKLVEVEKTGEIMTVLASNIFLCVIWIGLTFAMSDHLE